MLRLLGLGVVVAARLSAPTFSVWCLAFLNAKEALDRVRAKIQSG